MILISFQKRRKLDEYFVMELHRRLTQNTYDTRRWQIGERPGEYKRHDYVTGKEEIGAAPEDVAEEMEELLAELTEISNDKALTAAAYFHAKFENIHPFADGNGRTGRLLVIYLLLLYNHPPIIFPSETKKEYYPNFFENLFCSIIKISTAIQPTARGGLLLSFACDFGERLESLGLLWKHLEFFAYPASMQGMQKKGRV